MKKLQRKFATLTWKKLIVNFILCSPALTGYAWPLLKGSFSFVAFLN